MKKNLYATSALVAAGLLAGAGSAEAQGLKLGLGGYFQYYFAAASQDDGVGQPAEGKRNFDIKREAEVWFTGSVKLENGLTVGARIELEAETCGDQIDESYLFFSGNWGRIEAGSINGPTYRMHYAAPNVVNGMGHDPNYVIASAGNNRHGSNSIVTHSGHNFTGDSEKFSYYTPRMSGLQIGVAWTPDQSEEVTGGINARNGSFGGMTNSNNAGQYENIFDISANYVNKLGMVDVAASIGWMTGSREANVTLSTTQGPVRDTRNFVGAGLNLGYAGWTIGGSYSYDNAAQLAAVGTNTRAGTYNMRMWTLGLMYENGPWGFSAMYGGGQIDGDTGLGKDKLDRYDIGAAYTYGPGMKLVGGIQHWKYAGPDKTPTTTANDSTNKAWLFLLGTIITF
jgi:predicted porin